MLTIIAHIITVIRTVNSLDNMCSILILLN